jgi:hypothetical protein
MTEQTEHKPDPMTAIGHLDGVAWDLAMLIKYKDQPQSATVDRVIRHLRAALRAMEGPTK